MRTPSLRQLPGNALLAMAIIALTDPDPSCPKRISSKNKSGPFVGSEFAFEDFTATDYGKYDYKFIRNEPSPA